MIWIVLSAILLRAIMDVLFKAGLSNIPLAQLSKKALKSPFIWLAFVLCIINMILWTFILKHYPLSFAYPLFGLSFALIMLAGKWLFYEPFDTYKYCGLIAIIGSSIILLLG